MNISKPFTRTFLKDNPPNYEVSSSHGSESDSQRSAARKPLTRHDDANGQTLEGLRSAIRSLPQDHGSFTTSRSRAMVSSSSPDRHDLRVKIDPGLAQSSGRGDATPPVLPATSSSGADDRPAGRDRPSARLHNSTPLPRDRQSSADVAPALPDKTPFDREAVSFQKVQQVRREKVAKALWPTQCAERILEAKFFDGHRTPIESLSMELSSCNIECSPNNAHQSLNFITAMLAMATGVHGRKDLPEATRGLFDHDHEVHSAEANYLLQKINVRYGALADKPIGTIGPDANAVDKENEEGRVRYLLEMLKQSHQANFDVLVLSLKFQESPRSGNMTLLEQKKNFKGEGTSEKYPGHLIHDQESGSFLPLRTREVLTNSWLAPSLRYRQKSVAGKVSSVLTNLRSTIGFSARNKATKLLDPELYEKAIDKASGKPRIMGRDSHENEYIKEWLKRTDPNYDLQKQTLSQGRSYQRTGLPSRQSARAPNPFMGGDISLLNRLLNNPEHRRDRTQQKYLKKAIYHHYLLEKNPEAINPLPPTPVGVASLDKFKAVMADFNALLQPGGDPGATLLAGGRHDHFRELASQTQAAVVNGFKTGNRNDVDKACKRFQDALETFYGAETADSVAARATALRRPKSRRSLETISVVRRLEKSLADLAESRPPRPDKRTAEIADVLRMCAFTAKDVKKFSEAVVPVMQQRQEAFADLRRFLHKSAELQGISRRAIDAMAEAGLVTQTESILKKRNTDLETARYHVKTTRNTINDLVHSAQEFVDTASTANSPKHSTVSSPTRLPTSSLPNSPVTVGPFLAAIAEAGSSDASTGRDLADHLADLRTTLKSYENVLEDLERLAIENSDAQLHTTTQIAKLKNLDKPWSAIKAIWSTCDTFKKTQLPLEEHPNLLASTRRKLHMPMEILIRSTRHEMAS